MRRKLFNHYKAQKKLKRLFSRGIQPIVSPDAIDIKSTKDFAWHKTKQNPFYRTEKNWKHRFYLILGGSSILGMIILGIYHPFFHISQVEVHGLERISVQEFKSSVEGIMHYKKFFIFPAKSYFLCDVNEIKDVLLDRYPLSTIVVKRSFPHTVDVTVQEKISTIIYDNGREYSYLGLDGQIVEIIRKVGDDEWTHTKEITTSTDPMGAVQTSEKIISSVHVPPVKKIITEVGDYPIIYDELGKPGLVNDTVLKKEAVQNAIRWYEFLGSQLEVQFGYAIIHNAVGDASIHTRAGWEVKVNLSKDAEPQIAVLQTVLNSISSKKSYFNYIDVRYPGTAYWQ